MCLWSLFWLSFWFDPKLTNFERTYQPHSQQKFPTGFCHQLLKSECFCQQRCRPFFRLGYAVPIGIYRFGTWSPRFYPSQNQNLIDPNSYSKNWINKIKHLIVVPSFTQSQQASESLRSADLDSRRFESYQRDCCLRITTCFIAAACCSIIMFFGYLR